MCAMAEKRSPPRRYVHASVTSCARAFLFSRWDACKRRAALGPFAAGFAPSSVLAFSSPDAEKKRSSALALAFRNTCARLACNLCVCCAFTGHAAQLFSCGDSGSRFGLQWPHARQLLANFAESQRACAIEQANFLHCLRASATICSNAMQAKPAS